MSGHFQENLNLKITIVQAKHHAFLLFTWVVKSLSDIFFDSSPNLNISSDSLALTAEIM